MSASRTVTIRTADHGPVTIPEPSWCLGQHPDGGARIDITHAGPDVELTLPTRQGPVVYLATSLESRPFVPDAFLRGPFMGVGIGGDWHETGLPGLEAMADMLSAHADALRERARVLAAALEEGGRS
ncbi:DUF6907 domain-containing protein [Streptomyces sp. NPDC048392]|uniref:DUF6907 domain-containing protein n=1 Tax=Streptomyces sp. NPDC048392 TaxID=3365543 RepID=UPI00371145DD